jgi:hypothetical protein
VTFGLIPQLCCGGGSFGDYARLIEAQDLASANDHAAVDDNRIDIS